MTELVCTCPTNDQGVRVSIDPACRRHPGHKGIGSPDCWCLQDGLIGRLATAMDCPQHGRPRGASPMPRYATGGLISPRPDDGSLLVDLSPGYMLPADYAAALGIGSDLMAMPNDHGGPGASKPDMDFSSQAHAEAEARCRAEFAERESKARAWLRERVQAALIDELKRQTAAYPGFTAQTTTQPNLFVVDGILSVDELASATVDVFLAMLSDPPAMVTDQDGVTRVEQR